MLKSNQSPTLRNNIGNFLVDTPHCQEHYIGVVKERFEDNDGKSDDKPRNYKIKFNILGLPDFDPDGEWPVAILLGNSTRPVEVGDYVKIWDICDISVGLHTFFYEPVFEDRFTGIKNYNNYIDLTEKNYAEIKLPNATITFDRGGEHDSQADKEDGTGGSVELKTSNASISIDGSTGAISIKCGVTLEINGAQMGFTCLPNCPYTGAPHVQNKIPCA